MSTASDGDVRRFYVQLGGNIRSARVGAALSQAGLADRIGFTRASVSNLEAGRQKIALHLFVQIAQALGTEPTELLPDLSGHSETRVLEDLQQHIVDVPESAQDFVFGAISQLVAGQRNREQ